MKRFFNAILTLLLLAFVGCGELVENFDDYVHGTLAPGGKYRIGDYYNENGEEGVIFWVDKTGEHGKILSLVEPNHCGWTADADAQNQLIGTDSENNGLANTLKVMKISDWESKYPAFRWCTAFGEGWYLPAIEEVTIFTLNKKVRNAVNKTLTIKGMKLLNTGYYWSSTEVDDHRAFCVSMQYDDIFREGKYWNYNVRAVYAF